VADLTRLFDHVAGGRPAERLMTILGLPQSDDTILRSLKRHVGTRDWAEPVRVVGIDDWAWQEGRRYGTIMVDLEWREVVDVLPDRSAKATGQWLAEHRGIELVSRDRCGLYAEGARQRAPQAEQVASLLPGCMTQIARHFMAFVASSVRCAWISRQFAMRLPRPGAAARLKV
jgi:Transposase